MLQVIHQAILAPEELQVLILDDFIRLINQLLSQPTLSETLQSDLMSELVATFPQVYTTLCFFSSDIRFDKLFLFFLKVHNDQQPLLYLRLVEVMREHFNDKVKFQFEHLCALLQAFAVALPDPHTLRDPTENKLLQVVLEVLLHIFTSPSFTRADRNKLLEYAKEKKEKSFSHIFIHWLSHIEAHQTSLTDRTSVQRSEKSSSPPSTSFNVVTPTALTSGSTQQLPTIGSSLFSMISSPLSTGINNVNTSTPSSTQLSTSQTLDKLDLNTGLIKLIKILSTDNEGAKHFLELALTVLKNKPTSGFQIFLLMND